jgi:hypothetical protein
VLVILTPLFNPDSPAFLMLLLDGGLVTLVERGCRVKLWKLVAELMPPCDVFTDMPEELRKRIVKRIMSSLFLMDKAEWIVPLGEDVLLTVKGRAAAVEREASIRQLMRTL